MAEITPYQHELNRNLLDHPELISSYDDLPEFIQINLVTSDASNITKINNPTDKAIISALEAEPYLIKFIDDPSEDVQLYALYNDLTVWEFIKNPTYEVQKYLLRRVSNYIQYIENPSEEFMSIAVMNHSNSLKFIKNPSDYIKFLSIHCFPNSILDIPDASEYMMLVAIKNNYQLFRILPKLSYEYQLELVRDCPQFLVYYHSTKRDINEHKLDITDEMLLLALENSWNDGMYSNIINLCPINNKDDFNKKIKKLKLKYGPIL